jgi:GT2 family glycosyltransferase
MALKPFVRKALRKFRHWALFTRRRTARRFVASLHHASRSNRKTPFVIRAALLAYLAKRTLQEALVRHWPMTRLRRTRWIREVETAFTAKLLHWAHDRFDVPADAHALNRFNNRVLDADRAAMSIAAERWANRPLVSVLVPVYNARSEWLDRLIGSIVEQVYDRWELVLVDDASPNADVWPTLQRWADRDGRVVVERMPANRGVAAATNRAADLASGEFLAFADHDDELTPEALWCMVDALQDANDVDLVYSDEEIVPGNAPPHPMFKPAWSPELLVSFNYVCHLVLLRRSAFDAVGGFRLGFDGAQDHDLLLRLSGRLRRVVHVPRILYRWHVADDSMSRRVERATGDVVAAEGIHDKTRRVVQEHLDRQKLDAEATIVGGWCLPRYRPSDRGKASIIIPTKDNAECLRAAVQSIEGKTDYANYELLLVDTGAEAPEAQALLDELATRHQVLRYDGRRERFNWSRVNNWAVEQADGDVVVLLNDDVEVLEPGWLSALMAVATRSEVGAVGALLEYPDGKLQHAGVIVGAHGWGPWHVLMGLQLDRPTDYQGMAYFQRNCLAVTGACLAIRKDLFLDVGGFDADKLAVGFSDVDLCLRLHRRGFRNCYVPQARLIHKEGRSRGLRIDVTEAAELASRADGFVDPYWNPNFTRESHVPAVSSRRQAFGLRFANGARALAVFGGEPPEYGPPIDAAATERLDGRGDRQRIAQRLSDEEFDVLVAVGWDGCSAIKAAADAGIPAIWHLPRRALVEGRFSPTSFHPFARRWRAQNRAYQVVFGDVHSRACWQAGWPRNNSMVIQRVVAGRSLAEIDAERDRRRRDLPADAIVVAVDDDGDLERCLAEAVGRLADSLRKRLVVANADGVEAADAFLCQPFGQYRGLAPLTALACGVPMIGSRYLEHADLMHVGVTGLEVPELDSQALADALLELLPNVERRREMALQSRAWLASRASCQWVDAEWRELLVEAAELRCNQAGGSGEAGGAAKSDRTVPAGRREILTTSPIDRS